MAPQGCVLSPLLYSLYTYDCAATSSATIIVKFADDTVVMGLISDNDERAYLEEIKHLENWCQGNNLLLNVSKTKELIVDCSKKQERHYQSVRISGTTVERVNSFKYLGVYISQDLSWSCRTNSLAKKARQRLYHLRRLRDFRLPSKVLWNFYTCTIESIHTGNITVWFGNSTKHDRQALQRVVHSAERITHMELPDLQTIYYKRCQTKARRIVKDPTHPNNRLFSLLRSPRHNHRRHNLSNLTDSQRFTPSHIVVAGGLWNCQSAVQKADFISALASLHSLHFLALTETWITPENSAALAALSSAFSFTHSPRRLGRGSGTVCFPTKLLIIVIYRPPDSLDHFIDELDILLSHFPIAGNPFILLGDFNLPSDRLHSSCILLLLTGFDLTLNHSPPTHKAGNVLDLIFTHATTTSDISHPPPPLRPSLSILLSLPSFSFHPVFSNMFLLPPLQSALHNSLFPYFYYFVHPSLP
ncbi:hypothetical protein P4O66_004369 [Electrophorus voltai]|uniref:Reverse transcriptase domain-containing protein n=1 Tax=Electrophorus voltai TaxID=2609070 RepID=A0AAD9E4K1_9TELE|nr:hypothetical protein P4O66_004369 [Electrophorus voltai]